MTRIVRRVGTSPAQRGSTGGGNCPDVLKTDDGYLVIGEIAARTRALVEALDAHKASIGPWECAVIVPDDVLEAAAQEIAAKQHDLYPPDVSWLLQMQLDTGEWGSVFPSHDRSLVYSRMQQSALASPDRTYRVVRMTTHYVPDRLTEQVYELPQALPGADRTRTAT